MCFCGRYIRVHALADVRRGRLQDGRHQPLVPVEVEAAIDRRAVAGVQLARAVLLVAPGRQQLGRQHLGQGRLLAGGAEDHPGARAGRCG